MDSEPKVQEGINVQYQDESANIAAYIQEVRAKQSLPMGIIGGFIGALIGAVLWAVITVAVKWQIGWMAVGVGFLAGYGVRILGKGIDKQFSVAGAILSLLGCIAGNLLAITLILSSKYAVPVLNFMNIPLLLNLMVKAFDVMDLVFYAIAVYEGYRLSVIHIKINQTPGSTINS